MKTPHITANPQAIVITIQPAPLALDFSSVQAAHTPSPRRIITIVPMNSNTHLSKSVSSILLFRYYSFFPERALPIASLQPFLRFMTFSAGASGLNSVSADHCCLISSRSFQ